MLKKIKDWRPKKIRITILGKDVGKTTLLMKYSKYDESKENDIDYIFESNINIEGQDYKLELIDPISEDDYQNMMDVWISDGDGLILILAINDKETFDILKLRYEKAMKILNGRIYPMILVRNKKDLENERKVTYDEAKSVADSWGIEYIDFWKN